MASSFHRTYPVPPTSKQPIDANPKAIRLLFHTAAAGIMFQGFTGLQNVAVSKEVEPQVSEGKPCLHDVADSNSMEVRSLFREIDQR